MATLSSRLQEVIARAPEAVALVDGGQVWSYGALGEAISGLADKLRTAGVCSGHQVALLLPNGAEFVVALFAIAHLGGIALPLNPSLQEPEIASILRDAEVSLLITSDELRDHAGCALRSAGGLREKVIMLLRRVDMRGGGWPPGPTQPGLPVVSLYSSGSTGRPARIERTHFNFLYEADRLSATLALGPGDRVLGVSPFSHVNGLVRSLIASVLSGATLVPISRFERRAVCRAIQEQAITVFIGVPFMFAMLADARWPEPVDFSSLRLCLSTSAPLRPDVSRRFHQRYGIYVRQLYGTTETGTIALNMSSHIERSLDSVGTPLPGVEIKIVSPEGTPLAAEETGEIWIRSPAAARAYAGSVEKTRHAFVEGWFMSGDIGRMDSEGRIYLLGRKSLFINRAGYKVNPYEVEDVLAQHPMVQEAAVVGVGAEHGDQKVKAIVVLKSPCHERDLIEFCRGKIADFKIPSIVEFRSELPKSQTGKILRTAIQASDPVFPPV